MKKSSDQKYNSPKLPMDLPEHLDPTKKKTKSKNKPNKTTANTEKIKATKPQPQAKNDNNQDISCESLRLHYNDLLKTLKWKMGLVCSLSIFILLIFFNIFDKDSLKNWIPLDPTNPLSKLLILLIPSIMICITICYIFQNEFDLKNAYNEIEKIPQLKKMFGNGNFKYSLVHRVSLKITKLVACVSILVFSFYALSFGYNYYQTQNKPTWSPTIQKF